MLQCPEAATPRLNELFKAIMNEGATDVETYTNNSEPENYTSITKLQFEGLLLLIRSWEHPQIRIGRMNKCGGQQDTQQQVSQSYVANGKQGEGESDEIRRLKRDIFQYVHMNGLIAKMSKGCPQGNK